MANGDAPVVGRGTSNIPIPKPKVFPNTVLQGGVINRITEKLNAAGYRITPSTVTQLTLVDSFKPEELSVIYRLIKIRGYSPKKSIEDMRAILNTDQIMLSIAARSSDFSSFVKNLETDLLPGSTDEKEKLPTRTISEQNPEVLESLVTNWYKSVLSRPPSMEEKASRVAEMQAEIAKGTVTTSTKVKNPKTGKLETVVKSTPGFSQASAEARITEELKTLNPDDFDRAKRIEFSSWLSKNVAGA